MKKHAPASRKPPINHKAFETLEEYLGLIPIFSNHSLVLSSKL
ncbi:hypothetical protein [New Jersey aster yellows phytoplasma]|nr:hypothetical protein [New Jersey aster yellows phytoplasma]